MTRKRTGSIRLRGKTWFFGMRLRSGKWFEQKIDRPEDGGDYASYAEITRMQLVRAYEAGSWDPEYVKPEPVTGPTVLGYVRAWAETRKYESAPNDQRRVEQYIAPSPIADVLVADLKAKTVIGYIQWLVDRPSKSGGTLSTGSIHNAYGILQRAMKQAVIDELLPTNPCTLVRDHLPSKTDKHPGAREGWCFTRDEIERLISDTSIRQDRRVQYAILFLTGMRFGEFAALRWRDYDRGMAPLGRITVARAIKSVSLSEGATKTGAVKRVPVHPTLAAIMAEWYLSGWPAAFGRAPGPEDYVLPSVSGRDKGEPRTGQASNRTFKAEQERLGMRRRHQHVARHTFISLAQDDGADGAILRWVTHAPPRSAFDGYTRQQWGRLCAELGKLRIERQTGKIIGLREAR